MNRKITAAFLLGALSVGFPGYFIAYKWAESQAAGAFDLGLASGEAGYVNLFYERISDGKNVEPAAYYLICAAEYGLSRTIRRSEGNMMAGPANVIVPDAIRNSVEFRERNGLESAEECGEFVRETFSLEGQNT